MNTSHVTGESERKVIICKYINIWWKTMKNRWLVLILWQRAEQKYNTTKVYCKLDEFWHVSAVLR